MIRSIIQAPDPRLRAVADLLQDRDPATQVVTDLIDTFKETQNCIGLAATQLGHLWRAIIVDTTWNRVDTFIMVNPVIIQMSDDLQLVKDGCMSVANGKQFAETKRPKRITVTWMDLDTQLPRRQKFNGLLAAAIHHEIDHLDGILYTDRLAAAIAKGAVK